MSGRHCTYGRLATTTALVSVALLTIARADGPSGETVVGGAASVSRPADTQTTINQFTPRAIIDWQRFQVGEDHAVTFVQPDAASVILNRVTGGEPSWILGQMNANGTVMVVNPDGILFGPNSRIDVGGLVATTHDISNENFLAGRYIFDRPGNPSASIVNEGLITAREGGIAAFVAPAVRNSGIVSARLGKVGLAAANGFTLDLYGDDLIKLRVDDQIVDQVIDIATGEPVKALVSNEGTLSADGGVVTMTAATARTVVDHVINNDGVVEAKSVGMKNGRIVLSAQTRETKIPQAPAQTVRVSGKVDASGRETGQTGGDIKILGEILGLTRAKIDASGDAGGGVVLIGGDYLGGQASDEVMARYGIAREANAIPTSTFTYLDEESSIDASAITSGDGGKAVVWSDHTTAFFGDIRSTGGLTGGNGGFVEISGAGELKFDGTASTSAPKGDTGTLLFDPFRFYIGSPATPALVSDGAGFKIVTNDYTLPADEIDGTASISASAIESLLRNNNVSIQASPFYLRYNATTSTLENLSDGANIYFNEAIKLPAVGNDFQIFITGLGQIEINNVIDASDYKGDLSISAWSNGKLVSGPQGKIVGGSHKILLSFDKIGTPGTPVPIQVVPDAGTDASTFVECSYFAKCSDTGTKLLVTGYNNFLNDIFIRISPVDKFPDPAPVVPDPVPTPPPPVSVVEASEELPSTAVPSSIYKHVNMGISLRVDGPSESTNELIARIVDARDSAQSKIKLAYSGANLLLSVSDAVEALISGPLKLISFLTGENLKGSIDPVEEVTVRLNDRAGRSGSMSYNPRLAAEFIEFRKSNPTASRFIPDDITIRGID